MRIGLALGGGGARGFAHIGVLKVLRANGIDPEIVAGTSIGALVGAAYSVGNLDELEKRSTEIGLSDIPSLLSPSWSKKGLFSGKNALDLVAELVQVKNIEDLPKKFACVSADLTSGESVVFKNGDLRTALRASFAIPGIFTPIIDGEKVLVDGGTLDPLPVLAARELGADFVIAVDLFGGDFADPKVFTLRRKRFLEKGSESALEYIDRLAKKTTFTEKLNIDWMKSMLSIKERPVTEKINLIDIIERTFAVAQKGLTQAHLKQNPVGILIQPKVPHVSMLDFHNGKDIIKIGEDACTHMLPQILKRLSTP